MSVSHLFRVELVRLTGRAAEVNSVAIALPTPACANIPFQLEAVLADAAKIARVEPTRPSLGADKDPKTKARGQGNFVRKMRHAR